MKIFTPHKAPSLQLIELSPDSIIQPDDWMNHITNDWHRGFGFVLVDYDDLVIGRRVNTTHHYANNLRFFRPITTNETF